MQNMQNPTNDYTFNQRLQAFADQSLSAVQQCATQQGSLGSAVNGPQSIDGQLEALIAHLCCAADNLVALHTRLLGLKDEPNKVVSTNSPIPVGLQSKVNYALQLAYGVRFDVGRLHDGVGK